MKPGFEAYGLLWVNEKGEKEIRRILKKECKIDEQYIERGLHLTVYETNRPLPGWVPGSERVGIVADVCETRFMVMAPGGENPRPDQEPARRSVGIRLTRRNTAIQEILNLRRTLYEKETPELLGKHKPSSNWNSAFGARKYQPRIKLLRPGNGVDRDLTILGGNFRENLSQIEFSRFETTEGRRS